MKRLFLLFILLTSLFSCSKVESSTPDAGNEILGEITVRGIVHDENAAPMSGVVVSDGFKCVKTGNDGTFVLDSDLSKTRFVYVVQPSGYSMSADKGLPKFYKRLGKDDAQQVNGVYQIKFTLNKIKNNPEKYTVIFAGDPQPRSSGAGYDKFAYHSLDCCKDMWNDMKDYADSQNGNYMFGIMLGDLVHENMNLYADYLDGISRCGFPVYSVIGNHDNDPKGADDDAGAKYFEDNLGPRNYSFNAGKFHVVVVDNLIMKKNSSNELKDYEHGLTDDIWKWLQSDLKYVDYSTPVIICAHCPMFMRSHDVDYSQSLSTRHGADYSLLLSKFKKVYAWAGHTHAGFNYVYDSNSKLRNVEAHTVSRVTGALWLNEWLNEDGTPRGYVVAEIDGEKLSWKFKPIAYQTGKHINGKTPAYTYRDFSFNAEGVAIRNGKRLDGSYQLRAYPRGTYGDNYVYANVFMYDENWGDVKFVSEKNGTPPVVMTRVPEGDRKKYDAAYKEVFDFYKENVGTLHNSADYAMFDKAGNVINPVPHLFRCHSTATSDKGKVVVTDSFGNEYSANVSW